MFARSINQPGIKFSYQEAIQKNTQKASFEKFMSRISLERTEDEKRKKAGGGGGSSMRFDRLLVSLMLTNFLTNKQILALLESLNLKMLQQDIFMETYKSGKLNFKKVFSTQQFSNQIISFTNGLLYGIQHIKAGLISSNKMLGEYGKAFIIALSFQLNKAKEVLIEEFKERIKKVNFKGLLKMLKNNVIFESFESFISEIQYVFKALNIFFFEKLTSIS